MTKPLTIKILVAAFMPLVYAVAAAWQIWGRYFMPNHEWWADPEYDYLFSGLAVASGVAPWFLDHPGLPVQISNALFEVLAWRLNLFGTSSGSLVESVVAQPEQHLIALAVILLLAQAAALLYLGFRLQSSLSWPATWLAQSGPILALAVFPTIYGGNRPEVYLVLLITLALAVISPWVASPTAKPLGRVAIIFFGACLGFAVATKLSSIWIALLLPIVLINPRKILLAYTAAACAAGLSFIPALTRIPALPNIWLAWNSYAESPLRVILRAPTWLGLVAFQTYWFTGLLLVFVLSFLVLFVYKVRNSKFSLSGVSKPQIAFLIILIPVIVLQLTFVERWYAWWVIPLLPLTTFGLAVVISWLQRFLGMKWAPFAGAAISFLLVAVFLIEAVSGLAKSFSFPRYASTNEKNLVVDAVNSSTKAGRFIVFDYSIGWSHSPYGTECSSIIIGDAFGREIAADAIRKRCPRTGLAGFGQEAVMPLAPFLTLSPGEKLQHALYCQDLQKLAATPSGLSIITPARDFDYIEGEMVVEEGGWRLTQVMDIDCTGSPVRDERPNPATLAARERLSGVPVIGPIYRNWPFKDEIN